MYDKMDENVELIFKDIVMHNTDENLQAFFLDSMKDIAFGGHRRAWGKGDLFVRYMGKIDFPTGNPGVYHIPSKEFFKREELPGRKVEGQYTKIGIEECNSIFNEVIENATGHFMLSINPREVLEFISDVTFREGIMDRVINIHPFRTTNDKRHFPAQIEKTPEGRTIAVAITREGKIPMTIQREQSYVNVDRLVPGDIVIVDAVGVVNNERFVRVMREYVPGIRMAIQHFKGGNLMIGDPRYSIIPKEDGNTLTPSDVKDFGFLEGQVFDNISDAPMLTVQLDTFYRVMSAMSRYKRVAIYYKDNFSTFLVAPFEDEGFGIVEAAVSAFSPYKSGKLLTI